MIILNEYLMYLNEKDNKSKWKDKIKKYGKYVLGAAAYGGSKVIDKYKKQNSFKGKFNKRYQELLKKSKEKISKIQDNRKKKRNEKEIEIKKRHMRNVNTTQSKYQRWKRDRERKQDLKKREEYLDALKKKLIGDESKSSWFKRRSERKRKEKTIKNLKKSVGLN